MVNCIVAVTPTNGFSQPTPAATAVIACTSRVSWSPVIPETTESGCDRVHISRQLVLGHSQDSGVRLWSRAFLVSVSRIIHGTPVSEEAENSYTWAPHPNNGNTNINYLKNAKNLPTILSKQWWNTLLLSSLTTEIMNATLFMRSRFPWWANIAPNNVTKPLFD